jgi:ankyrin repeat protein
MQDRKYRFSCYISLCILNNIHDIENLLRRYNDPFIMEKNDDGDNGVSLAAVESARYVLIYLHSKGTDLNNVNKNGRTPLMQDSLWGRIQVVDFLLSQQVNPLLRDCKGKIL